MNAPLHKPMLMAACATSFLMLTGCEAMLAVMEVTESVAADEMAKREDDPAAYEACDRAYRMCKQVGGFGVPQCEEQRAILIEEGIYCGKVGVMTGSRAR